MKKAPGEPPGLLAFFEEYPPKVYYENPQFHYTRDQLRVDGQWEEPLELEGGVFVLEGHTPQVEQLQAPPDQYPSGSTTGELMESWKVVQHKVRNIPTHSEKNCQLALELTRNESPLDSQWTVHCEEELQKAKEGERPAHSQRAQVGLGLLPAVARLQARPRCTRQGLRWQARWLC